MEDTDPSEPARRPHPRGEPASFSIAACGPLNTTAGGGVQEWALTNWERIRKYSPAGLGDILSVFSTRHAQIKQKRTRALALQVRFPEQKAQIGKYSVTK